MRLIGILALTISAVEGTRLTSSKFGYYRNTMKYSEVILNSLQPSTESKERPFVPKKTHLVLHFDVNETILVGDEAGGDSREDILNKMLAKNAYVRVPGMDKNSKQSVYEVDTTQLEPTHWWNGSPIKENYEVNDSLPPIYTGWDWPEGCCPYYRTKFKKRADNFVAHHGSIYKSIHGTLDRCMQPKDPSAFKDLPALSNIIPAFFHTLAYLSQTTQSFTLVFRTFGTDLPEIAKIITAFARGQHPDYPDFRNEKLVLELDDIVQGRWKENADGSAEYQLWKDGTVVASGDADILDFMHSQTVCGIQDDYQFWRKNNFQPWSGKPVWVPKDKRFHHVLLDDNIHNLNHYSIASVRKELEDGTFSSLAAEDIRKEHGLYLIRIPTVEPVLKESWFLEQIAGAQELFELEHRSRATT